MDTNLTLELFIGRGMIDKSLAKDIKEEMTVSGKELPEVLADFGIIGSKDDIWQMIASDLGTEFITLDNFQPGPERAEHECRPRSCACTAPCPCGTARKACTSAWWTP